MKRSKRIAVSTSFLETHKLSADAPPKDALFWQLWEASKTTAEACLETGFIKGIQAGNLDPTTYGAFNISDAYYCFQGSEDYQKAVDRTTNDDTLKAFLAKKQKSYADYNATFPDTWRVSGTESINPTTACKNYSDYEAKIVTTADPIFCLVVMLPCEYLWAWLGAQLSPAAKDNLYASWINGNNDPSGAYTMGNFLEYYRHTHPFDEGQAIQIYQTAMEHELLNFQSATS